MAIITLTVLTDIYSKEDKLGRRKIIKKDAEYRKQFDTNALLVEELLSSTGKPSNKHCFVKEGDTYFKLKHSFSYIEKLVQPIKVNGFKYGE